MQFRIIEYRNPPLDRAQCRDILLEGLNYSLQVELLVSGAPAWFTITKNRNFNALLALAGENKLAFEIVRDDP